MKASPRQQRLLLQLQDLDTPRERLERRRRNLPEAEQVKDLELLDASLRDEFMGAQRVVEELTVEISRAEDDLRVVLQRAERTSERLAASVASREAQALQDELSVLKQRQDVLEERELDLLQQQEDARSVFDAVAARMTEHDHTKRDAQEALEAARARIDQEIRQLDDERAGLAAEVQGDIRAVYERTRERYGIGAARLVGRVSEGSNLELDAADYSAAMGTPDDELYFCPVSGAILVRDSDENAVDWKSVV